MPGVRTADLAPLALLEGARGEGVEELAALLSPLAAGPGEVLVREGEPARTFALVRDGAADVTLAGRRLARLGPGDVVGELALLRGAPRAATVTATHPLTGWRGDEAAFAALVGLPGVAERLARTARQRLAGLLRPVEVPLRDGRPVRLRPVLPGDRQRAAASPEVFSPDTLYRRFLSGRRLTDAVLRYLTEVDYVHHFVWMALADGVAIGDARLVRAAAEPASAEVAFTVGDAHQGRGLGTVLLGALAVAAQELDVERFTARVLSDNRPMRRILDRAAGGRAPWSLDDPGVVATTVPVPDPAPFLPAVATAQQLREAVDQVVRTFG